MKPGIFVHGILLALLLPLLCASVPASVYAYQDQSNSSIPLELDKALPLQLNAIRSHTLTVTVQAGSYVQVAFTWGGIDLDVTVRAPSGSTVFPATIPVRGSGSLPVSFIAESGGNYSLEVRAVDQLNYYGNYLVVLQALRQPTPQDKTTFEATKATLEALNQKTKPLTIDGLLHAVELWSSIPEGSGKAFVLQRLGNAYMSNKEAVKADAEYTRAIQLHEGLGNTRSLVYTWRDLGADYRQYASPEVAIEKYQKALPIAQAANDRRAESDLQYSIGFAHARIGRMQIAIGFYEKALAIQQAEKDELNDARTLNAMAGAYDAMGMKSQAMTFYQQAFDKFAQLGDRYRQAITINNIGVIHDDWGDYESARENYEAAFAGYKGLFSTDAKLESICGFGAPARMRTICSAMASALDNLGELSNTLGDPGTALLKFYDSQAITELLEQPQLTGSTLSRICYSHILLGKPEIALDYCNRALKLNEETTDLRTTASTLTFLGMASVALNNSAQAFMHFEKALAKQQEAADRRGQSITLDQMASLYAAGRRWDQANQYFNRALQLWKDIGDPDGQSMTLYDWARSERDRGDYDSAAKLIGQSLDIVESTRARLRSRQLLGYYFAGKQNYYELKIDIEMLRAAQTGSNESVIAAFEAREHANARNLLAALNEAKFLRSEILGSNDPQLKKFIEQQQTLGQNLNSRENQRRDLLSKKHDEARRVEINKAIDELVKEYDRIEVKIRGLNSRIADLKDPLPARAQQIQRELDSDTLLLQFSLGDKRSYVWGVTNETIRGFELAPRERIEAEATRLQHALTARNRVEANETSRRRNERWANADKEYADAAAALSKLILEPVASMLGQKRLVVVADGALQLIPFTVLPQPASPGAAGPSTLIAKREIVSLPSASVLALQRRDFANRKPAPLAVAVLADPVFDRDDQRVADAVSVARKQKKNSLTQNTAPPVSKNHNSSVALALRSVGLDPDSALQRLLKSRLEATQISRFDPSHSFTALDFKANRATASSEELSKYRYIHFATHGVVDIERPELSGIVLSMVDEKGKEQDGYLRLYEIYKLNLPAELVVLSACQTGVGKQVRGEGLIALTRGFMHAGAARVVASLWKVDDSATAALMTQFYKEMFANGKRPSAALRDAQLAISQQKQWQSPYFWAGFVLQGEWR